jgi:O-antigen ligase
VLKNALAALRITHLSLALVALMWVFPFLHVSHAYPLTTFYQEWWSGLLGLLAMVLLVERVYWDNPEVPRIAQLPMALIVVTMLQWLLGMLAYFDQALLYVMYLLFAVLLILLGARLRDCLGLLKLSQMLAVALLIGAELNAFVGVMQHFNWHTFFDGMVIAKMSAVVYGNLAQPNHFANYIALGMISLGFLFQQKKLKSGYVALLAVPMLFVMTMSASRSSWLYLLLMAAMAWWWSRRDASLKTLLRYSVLLIIGFGLMHLVVQMQVMTTETGSINTVARLLDHEETGDIRLYLWHEAGVMFMQSPLLGVGFGQFAWQHFQLLPELKQSNILGLYNNAHNLIFQLAAETGAIGLLILFASLGVWAYAIRCVKLGVEHWWGYAILGVLAIHSLLEYPLWYSYFLAVAAVLLGMFDETRYQLKLRFIGRMSLASILLLGLLVLLQLMNGYKDLERTMAESSASASTVDAQAAATNMRESLTSLHRVPLLSPYAELFMSERMAIDAQYIKEKLTLNTRVTRFVPIAAVVYRQALLLAQNAQLPQAKAIWNQATWSYPEARLHQQQKLAALAAKDPAHFSGLLEFALEKEQEQASAIHNQ